MAQATVEQIKQSAYRQTKAQTEQEAKAIVAMLKVNVPANIGEAFKAIAQKRSLRAHLKRSELLALVKFVGKDALHMEVVYEADGKRVEIFRCKLPEDGYNRTRIDWATVVSNAIRDRLNQPFDNFLEDLKKDPTVTDVHAKVTAEIERLSDKVIPALTSELLWMWHEDPKSPKYEVFVKQVEDRTILNTHEKKAREIDEHWLTRRMTKSLNDKLSYLCNPEAHPRKRAKTGAGRQPHDYDEEYLDCIDREQRTLKDKGFRHMQDK